MKRLLPPPRRVQLPEDRLELELAEMEAGIRVGFPRVPPPPPHSDYPSEKQIAIREPELDGVQIALRVLGVTLLVVMWLLMRAWWRSI